MTILEFECSYESLEELKNTTLVVPSPGSIGFLSSLSIDLIINTTKGQRLGMIYSPYMEHIVGNGVYDEERKIHTALELYKVGDYSVLQVRSSPLVGHGLSFSKSLAHWIKKCKFKDVVFLTGLDKSRRNDQQLNSSPLRYISNNESWSASCEEIGVKGLEPLDSPHTLYHNQLPPGGGMTQFILNELNDFSWTVVSMFVGNGDNFIAAHAFADIAAQILSLEHSSWIYPKSWEALYKPENQVFVNDQEIYC